HVRRVGGVPSGDPHQAGRTDRVTLPVRRPPAGGGVRAGPRYPPGFRVKTLTPEPAGRPPPEFGPRNRPKVLCQGGAHGAQCTDIWHGPNGGQLVNPAQPSLTGGTPDRRDAASPRVG